MPPLSMCPACKRLSLRADGVCMNPGHPGGQAPAATSPPGGTRPAARPATAATPGAQASMAPNPSWQAPEPSRRRQKAATQRDSASSGEDGGGGKGRSALRTAAWGVGILLLAGLVLFGSAQASALFRRSSGDPPAVTEGGREVAMPRPKSCTGDSIWGVRRIAEGQNAWSCTTRDGKNVRFYDVAMADLAKHPTLRCPTDGIDGKSRYVDCVKTTKKK